MFRNTLEYEMYAFLINFVDNMIQIVDIKLEFVNVYLVVSICFNVCWKPILPVFNVDCCWKWVVSVTSIVYRDVVVQCGRLVTTIPGTRYSVPDYPDCGVIPTRIMHTASSRLAPGMVITIPGSQMCQDKKQTKGTIITP